jgi:hypothetical protein
MEVSLRGIGDAAIPNVAGSIPLDTRPIDPGYAIPHFISSFAPCFGIGKSDGMGNPLCPAAWLVVGVLAWFLFGGKR